MAESEALSMVSESELSILKILWKRPGLKVGDIRDILNNRGKDWAYNTVQTLIKRLENKGYVGSVKEGRAFAFSPAVSRSEYLTSHLNSIAERVCAGSRTPMMHALVEQHQFSREEIDDFRTLLDQLESDFDAENGIEGCGS